MTLKLFHYYVYLSLQLPYVNIRVTHTNRTIVNIHQRTSRYVLCWQPRREFKYKNIKNVVKFVPPIAQVVETHIETWKSRQTTLFTIFLTQIFIIKTRFMFVCLFICSSGLY